MAKEAWWVWHWDRATVEDTHLHFESITRWRRGSLLTVYRLVSATEIAWWFAGPFNIEIGFSVPKKLTWSGR